MFPKEVNELVKKLATEIMGDLCNEDVPDYLEDLLALENKKELKRYSKKIIIKEEYYVLLVRNSHKIGYKHRMQHHEFIPEHISSSLMKCVEFAKNKRVLTS